MSKNSNEDIINLLMSFSSPRDKVNMFLLSKNFLSRKNDLPEVIIDLLMSSFSSHRDRINMILLSKIFLSSSKKYEKKYYKSLNANSYEDFKSRISNLQATYPYVSNSLIDKFLSNELSVPKNGKALDYIQHGHRQLILY